ncbi:MAG TPA: hypothetical protein VMV71_03495 [Candidatus Paceibacterota bacterium]|nr:hypothetical protein [Candidatus Paceibacterota bacterium]
MAKTIQDEFLYKKVYEFSYATSRIALASGNREIAELLEGKAVHLLDSVLVADYAKTRDLINSIISLASLMVDSGLLNSINREVLIRESESVNLAIQALPKEQKAKEILPDLNLNKIFSKSTLPTRPVRSSPSLGSYGAHLYAGASSNGVKRQIADKQTKPVVQSEMVQNQSATHLADEQVADNSFASVATSNIADNSTKLTTSEIADKTIEEVSPFKSEVRQSAIIAKLQQGENLPGRQAGCRLNELQELFPNISERTLRYDLESLISDGFIERIGSRRNSVYQLVRPSSSPSDSLRDLKRAGAAQTAGAPRPTSPDEVMARGQENRNSAVIELPSHSANSQGF